MIPNVGFFLEEQLLVPSFHQVMPAVRQLSESVWQPCLPVFLAPVLAEELIPGLLIVVSSIELLLMLLQKKNNNINLLYKTLHIERRKTVHRDLVSWRPCSCCWYIWCSSLVPCAFTKLFNSAISFLNSSDAHLGWIGIFIVRKKDRKLYCSLHTFLHSVKNWVH